MRTTVSEFDALTPFILTFINYVMANILPHVLQYIVSDRKYAMSVMPHDDNKYISYKIKYADTLTHVIAMTVRSRSAIYTTNKSSFIIFDFKLNRQGIMFDNI